MFWAPAVCRAQLSLMVSGCSQLESVLPPWVCGIWHQPPRLCRTAPAFATCEADGRIQQGAAPEVLLMLLLGAVSHSQPSNSSQPAASRPWLELSHHGFQVSSAFSFRLPRASAVRLPGASRREVPGAVATAPAPVRGVERDADAPGVASQGPQLSSPRQECAGQAPI